MRTPLVAAAVAAALIVPAAAAPAHAARPAAPFQCPVNIRVTHDSGTRSGPSATHAPVTITRHGRRVAYRVKGGERWWSSRRVNGWASLGGLGGGQWRHGPWVPPGAYRVVSDCDWRTP